MALTFQPIDANADIDGHRFSDKVDDHNICGLGSTFSRLSAPKDATTCTFTPAPFGDLIEITQNEGDWQ